MEKNTMFYFSGLLILYIFFSGPIIAQQGFYVNSLKQQTDSSNFSVQAYDFIVVDEVDLQVNDNFYAIAPNALWPASQVECFGFLADVRNNGSSDATGANLNISIEDNTNGVIYTDDLLYGVIAANTTIENVPFLNCFTPDGSINEYTGTYWLTSDSFETNITNNVQSFTFETTLETFSKETGANFTITPDTPDEENQSWAWGNFYYIVAGCPTLATNAIFGIGNANADGMAGRLLAIYLYEWENDINGDGNMDPNERTRVGKHIYTIQGTETPTDLITVPLNNFPSCDSGPIELKNETAYVLMLEYVTFDNNKLFLPASDQFNYSAQVFLSDEIFEKPRYAAMLGVSNDLEAEPYESTGFGRDIVPVARLQVISILDNVDTALDEANLIRLSPNPANEFIHVNMELQERLPLAQIRIMDINGKVLIQKELKNIQRASIDFEVNAFAAGTYTLQFISDAGMRTIPFVKI